MVLNVQMKLLRSGVKASDQVQGQGVPRIGSGAYTEYVSIATRGTTPPLGLRWGFDTTSSTVPYPAGPVAVRAILE
jgi:hypothetical protein